MVKRILHLITEEQQEMDRDSLDEDQLEEVDDEMNRLRAFVRQGITELIDEIENSTTNIANQALEHIHSR